MKQMMNDRIELNDYFSRRRRRRQYKEKKKSANFC